MQDPEKKAGYFIIRLKPREGVLVTNEICQSCKEKLEVPTTTEVRLASMESRREGEAQIAIRAPKDMLIRRLK